MHEMLLDVGMWWRSQFTFNRIESHWNAGSCVKKHSQNIYTIFDCRQVRCSHLYWSIKMMIVSKIPKKTDRRCREWMSLWKCFVLANGCAPCVIINTLFSLDPVNMNVHVYCIACVRVICEVVFVFLQNIWWCTYDAYNAISHHLGKMPRRTNKKTESQRGRIIEREKIKTITNCLMA